MTLMPLKQSPATCKPAASCPAAVVRVCSSLLVRALEPLPLLLLAFVPVTAWTAEPPAAAAPLPTFAVTPAERIAFPGGHNPNRGRDFTADCCSPLFWNGDTLHVINSWERPWVGSGPDLFHLKRGAAATIDPRLEGLWLWLESVWRDEDGTLYGWMHNEFPGVCSQEARTGMPAAAPGYPVLSRIAAVRSKDNGRTWESLGFIFDGRPKEIRCDTKGPWYAGGVGDFGVIADREQEYFCIFFSSFAPDVAEQGMCMARYRVKDRDDPVGKVRIWHEGRWDQPAVGGGRVTPLLPIEGDIHREDGHIFWGASVHWNTHLERHVMVINRTRNSRWDTEGQYILFSGDLADPRSWSRPERLIDPKLVGKGWYVQVVGTGKGETDTLASGKARLFIDGESKWEITFEKPGEQP